MHRLPAPDRRWRHCSLLDTSWGTVPFQDAKMVPAGEARDIAGVAEEAGDVGRADAVQVEQAVAGRAAVWTAEHLAGFLTSVIDDSLFALWWLIGLGGLRRGEACGLRWSEVDLDCRVLFIVRNRTTAGYQVVEGPPETAAGTRAIALDKHTCR